MIGNTAIDVHLQKAKNLDDGIAWFEANDKLVREAIIKLIQLSQLKAKGVDSNERVIGYYSALTELISGGRKKQGQPYTLEDTGDFYRSIQLKPNSNQ